MTHRHHYTYGEPTITVILVAAVAVALAMCRYWCRDAKHHGARGACRRAGTGGARATMHGRRRRRGDVITHHLILQVPATLGTIDGQPLQTLEFTASAPRYSLVMQNPSVYVHASPCARAPETPPPPYPGSQSLLSYTIVDTIPEETNEIKAEYV